jgi:enoyl-CoA hydratase/carnithine racemase
MSAESRTFDDLIIERRDNALWVRLTRPEVLNAIRPATKLELLDVLSSVRADETIRVLVLTGTGRAFCSGADTRELDATPGTESNDDGEFRRDVANLELTQAIVRELHDSPAVTIAGVNGLAVCGGVALALACDLCVATEDAVLDIDFARRSLMPDAGLIWTLAESMSQRAIRHLLLIQKSMTAVEAAKAGLISEVVPDVDRLNERLEELSASLTNWSADILWLTKRIYGGTRTSGPGLLEALSQARAIGRRRHRVDAGVGTLGDSARAR